MARVKCGDLVGHTSEVVSHGGPGNYRHVVVKFVADKWPPEVQNGYVPGSRTFSLSGVEGTLTTDVIRGGPGNYPSPVFSFVPSDPNALQPL